ncbi:MAG: OmpH family outer membrane protein [Hyphomonadaceae bacterium]|nr:OmpH family outer membrane protein [Hyphomonadaceae bacterium]
MRIAKALIIASAIAASALGAMGVGAAVAQSNNSPVLVLNLQKVRQDAPAWADMTTKVKTLVEQKTTEFRTQNQAAATALQTEARNLQPLMQGKTEAQIMADAGLKGRVETQVRRERDLQQKQQLFQYSVQATTEAADRQLLLLLDPIVGQIMTQRGAVVVLDQTQIAKANPSIEITQEATTRFNAAHPRAPQPVWTPVTIAPPEGAPGQAKANQKK